MSCPRNVGFDQEMFASEIRMTLWKAKKNGVFLGNPKISSTDHEELKIDVTLAGAIQRITIEGEICV